jgi:hypothetical protein
MIFSFWPTIAGVLVHPMSDVRRLEFLKAYQVLRSPTGLDRGAENAASREMPNLSYRINILL